MSNPDLHTKLQDSAALTKDLMSALRDMAIAGETIQTLHDLRQQWPTDSSAQAVKQAWQQSTQVHQFTADSISPTPVTTTGHTTPVNARSQAHSAQISEPEEQSGQHPEQLPDDTVTTAPPSKASTPAQRPSMSMPSSGPASPVLQSTTSAHTTISRAASVASQPGRERADSGLSVLQADMVPATVTTPASTPSIAQQAMAESSAAPTPCDTSPRRPITPPRPTPSTGSPLVPPQAAPSSAASVMSEHALAIQPAARAMPSAMDTMAALKAVRSKTPNMLQRSSGLHSTGTTAHMSAEDVVVPGAAVSLQRRSQSTQRARSVRRGINMSALIARGSATASQPASQASSRAGSPAKDQRS